MGEPARMLNQGLKSVRKHGASSLVNGGTNGQGASRLEGELVQNVPLSSPRSAANGIELFDVRSTPEISWFHMYEDIEFLDFLDNRGGGHRKPGSFRHNSFLEFERDFLDFLDSSGGSESKMNFA